MKQPTTAWPKCHGQMWVRMLYASIQVLPCSYPRKVYLASRDRDCRSLTSRCSFGGAGLRVFAWFLCKTRKVLDTFKQVLSQFTHLLSWFGYMYTCFLTPVTVEKIISLQKKMHSFCRTWAALSEKSILSFLWWLYAEKSLKIGSKLGYWHTVLV